MNKFPAWKYVLLLLIVIGGFIYALPNIYPADPAVQITGKDNTIASKTTMTKIVDTLKSHQLDYKSIKLADATILVRFSDTEVQIKSRDVIKATLGNDYAVALNLAANTPTWLADLGGTPMNQGLDLRGGISMLISVDVDSVIQRNAEGDVRSMMQRLRENKIRYAGMSHNKKGIVIQFRNAALLDQAQDVLSDYFKDYVLKTDDSNLKLYAKLSINGLQKIRDFALDKTIIALKKRVNELGVSEATVQKQGADRVVVTLPGIQDTARAKDILGKTATVAFYLVDDQASPTGMLPAGTRLLHEEDGRPIVIKRRHVLSGDSIVGASASIYEDGRPAVFIRASGSEVSYFNQTTAENIGRAMASVYVELKPETKMVNGKPVITYKKHEEVISVATIQGALGNQFVISGLDSMQYARNLSLLLRAGAMPANTSIISEQLVGPSLGKLNIDRGILSVEIGFLIIVLLMGFYYSVFGWIANFALGLNLVLILAIMSALGFTLTLPGIAGIVLTVGMAVDANVLIFERIREELRNGMSAQASIHAGYEKAFITIVDANVTTLIVAIVLFALGTGPIKGFAVTLTIGLLTSMYTAITGTRAIVNLLYGNKKRLDSLPIGIQVK